MLTDPIADMLTRLRNANLALHDTVVMPTSKMKQSVAQLLQDEGYIAGYAVDGRELTVRLKYDKERRRVLSGIRRMSKPGRRVYLASDDVPRVLGGMGISILTTSRGIMTGHEAKKANVGGELLAYVW